MGRSLTSAQQQCEAAEKDLIYTKQKMRELKAKEADLKSQWNKRREMKEVCLMSLAKSSFSNLLLFPFRLNADSFTRHRTT